MGQEWFGWIGRILRVDLSKKKVVKQELPKDLARGYIGCRGINAKILYDEVKAGTDAFGPENVLIFGTGPLEGTPVGMGRVSITTKSPRGCMAEGGFGGFFGPELKFAGYDHIVVTGRAEKPVYVWIKDDDVEIRDAAQIWGKTTWETDKIVRDEFGDRDIQICSIGPAAENLVEASVIISGLYHSGGRTDCGTVMGAKKLKAIAVRGSGGVKVARPEEFERAWMKMREIVDIGKGLDQYIVPYGVFSPPMQMRILNAICCNMSYNAQKMRFEFSDDVSGEKYMEKYVVRPSACFCCLWPSCGTWYEVREGPYAGTKGGGLQAASVMGFCALTGVNYLPAALKAWTLCNQLGLDLFLACISIAWAMECYQKGILTKEDMDGLDLKFGNHEAMIEMIKKIAYRDGFGSILADGVTKAAKKIGKGSERFALAVKGRELEMMPERNLYVGALGVAVSETGPDHTRWYPPYPGNPALLSPEKREELKLDFDLKEALETRSPRGKGRLLKFLEDRGAVVESIPSCVYLIRGMLSWDPGLWRDMLVAGTGVDLTREEMMTAGERIRNIERAFIVREGFRREDDTIPRRMREEGVPECHFGPLTQKSLNYMLDEYYEARGWDKQTAIPRRAKLEELGLGEVADEFERLGIKVT